MTIIARSISEKASETIKKFCTVRSGRNVKTDRITRMFPHIHKTTMLERTKATGSALINGIGRIVDDDNAVEFMDVNKLSDGDDKTAIFESLDEIKYQSMLLIFNGTRRSWIKFSFAESKSGKYRLSTSL